MRSFYVYVFYCRFSWEWIWNNTGINTRFHFYKYMFIYNSLKNYKKSSLWVDANTFLIEMGEYHYKILACISYHKLRKEILLFGSKILFVNRDKVILTQQSHRQIRLDQYSGTDGGRKLCMKLKVVNFFHGCRKSHRNHVTNNMTWESISGWSLRFWCEIVV